MHFTVASARAHLLDTRLSQLKPFAFKFPWSGLYLRMFAIALGATLAVIWIHAIRQALRDESSGAGAGFGAGSYGSSVRCKLTL